MINNLVEGRIRKICGKFIRNYDQSKVEVSLTGTVQMSKLDLRVEEFDKFDLPYSPAFFYIDSLSFDLPILLSSRFSLIVKDALFIVRKGTDVSELDAYTAQKSLQTVLGVLYLNLTSAMRTMHSGASSGISTVELEYALKTSDRLSLELENVHFRVEEDFSCHYPYNIDSQYMGTDSDDCEDIFKRLTVLGLVVKRAALRPPTSEEINDDSSADKQRVWVEEANASLFNSINIRKIFLTEGVSVYCGREYSSIPAKHDERIRVRRSRKSRADIKKRMDESVILGGGDSDLDSDCASDASTDDGIKSDDISFDGNVIEGDEDSDGQCDNQGDQYNFAQTVDGTPTLKYLEFISRRRSSEDQMVDDFAFTARMSVVYQTRNQVFVPLRLHIKLNGADVNINDVQAAYLSRLTLLAKDYIDSLQRKCMLECLTCSGSGLRTIDTEGKKGLDTRRRARLRWKLIRNSISKDWYRYAAKLKEGRFRWRAWFKQWRLCARYVALRELLIFHVGFEGEDSQGLTNYKLFETLLIDHMRGNPTDPSLKSSKAYRGLGATAEGVMRVAEILVRKKMIGTMARDQGGNSSKPSSLVDATGNTISTVQNHDGETIVASERHLEEEEGISLQEICVPGSAAGLMLSSRTVRALYSMQLELDSLLPLSTITYCRYLADERFRRMREKSQEREAALMGSQNQLVEGNSRIHHGTKAVLLLCVLDAVNLTAGSLGMSRVEASCSIRAHHFRKEPSHNQDKEGLAEEIFVDSTNLRTGVSVGKVHESTGTAFCAWGQVLELELNEDKAPASLCDLEVECLCRGIFSPTYGNLVSPLPSVLGPHVDMSKVNNELREALQEETRVECAERTENISRQEAPRYEGALHTLHANLDTTRMRVHNGDAQSLVRDSSRRATYASMQTAAEGAVSVRMFSKVVVGTPSAIAEIRAKLKDTATGAINERREWVARSRALASRPEVGYVGEEEEDDTFILDPTSLTIKNLQFTIEVPEDDPIRYTQSALYTVPSSMMNDGHKELLEMTRLCPVPIYRVIISGLKTRITASNNPWEGECSVAIPEVKVEVAAKADGEENALTPVIMLPPLDLSIRLSQTSTTGRLLGAWGTGAGSLDESCFEWWASGSFGPFSILLKPLSEEDAIYKDEDTSSEVVWRTKVPLSHIFEPFFGFSEIWSRGIFNSKVGNEDGSSPAMMSSEHAIRLGDHYSIFPRFRNAPQMVSISTTMPRYEGQAAKLLETPLATQRTGISLYTLSRRLTIDANFAPSRSALVRGTTDTPTKRDVPVETATESQPVDIWKILAGGAKASNYKGRGAGTAHSEKEESRLRALQKLHTAQMDAEKKRFALREAKLLEEIAALKSEAARNQAERDGKS